MIQNDMFYIPQLKVVFHYETRVPWAHCSPEKTFQINKPSVYIITLRRKNY